MNPKTHLFRAEGFALVLIVGGYLSLCIISFIKWNDAISGSLVTGFAVFAQSIVKEIFGLMRSQADQPDQPDAPPLEPITEEPAKPAAGPAPTQPTPAPTSAEPTTGVAPVKATVIALIAAITLAGTIHAQNTTGVGTGNPAQDLANLEADYIAGAITNVILLPGIALNEKTHQVGGELLLGYNLPKMTAIPLQPYLVPVVGVIGTGGSLYGFSGTVGLQTDLHPLRFFAGNATNGFAYGFTLTPNICGGVGENLSGQQFGSFKVPGKAALNGKGTAAVTGQGLSFSVYQGATVKAGGWFERTNWTTIQGAEDMIGVYVQVAPKGW